jgi:outer membrane protein assembly factor BamA
LLKTGDILDPELLFETQRRLTALGLFKQVVVRFLEPEAVEKTKDIVVEVRERPRISGDVSGGYSLADGPRVVLDATYPNLFGQGLTLSARGQVNYVGLSSQVLTRFYDPSQLQGLAGLAGRGSVSLQQQRIYQLAPAQIGARLDLIAERVLRPSYRFNRYAAVAGLTWIVTRWFTVGLNYELEQDQVQAAEGVVQLLPTLVRGDAERLRFPVGVFNLQTLAPSFALDFRDNPTNPTRGVKIAVNTEITKDLGATLTDGEGNPTGTTHIFTFKASANITGYVPMGAGIVLAVSLRGGRIYRLDPNSTTIAPKRFFLGGATTLRGFGEDGLLPQDQRDILHQQVQSCRALANPGGCSASASALLAGQQLPSEGGELFTLAKAELRIPVYGSFALGVFGEAGNLYLDASQYQPFNLRYVAGVGIRYLTPVGPLALDLAFNLIPDTLLNESNPNVQFSVGLF